MSNNTYNVSVGEEGGKWGGDLQIYIAHAQVNVADPNEQRHAPEPDSKDEEIVDSEQ